VKRHPPAWPARRNRPPPNRCRGAWFGGPQTNGDRRFVRTGPWRGTNCSKARAPPTSQAGKAQLAEQTRFSKPANTTPRKKPRQSLKQFRAQVLGIESPGPKLPRIHRRRRADAAVTLSRPKRWNESQIESGPWQADCKAESRSGSGWWGQPGLGPTGRTGGLPEANAGRGRCGAPQIQPAALL